MKRSALIIGILSAVVAVETVMLLRPQPDPPAAEFSGEVISMSSLDEKLRELFGRETLEELITQRLVDKAVVQSGLEVAPSEIDKWVADYKKRPDVQEMAVSGQLDVEKLRRSLHRSVLMYKLILQDVSEPERKKYFQDNRSRFEEMEMRGILLGSEAEAAELAGRATSLDAFSSMAVVHSLDTHTRDIGGRLGRVTRAELEESFDPLSVQELFNQKIGSVSQPMASSSGGWYLFWICSRTVDYDSLRLRVMEAMASERTGQFLERLRLQANVKILLPDSSGSSVPSGTESPDKSASGTKEAGKSASSVPEGKKAGNASGTSAPSAGKSVQSKQPADAAGADSKGLSSSDDNTGSQSAAK